MPKIVVLWLVCPSIVFRLVLIVQSAARITQTSNGGEIINMIANGLPEMARAARVTKGEKLGAGRRPLQQIAQIRVASAQCKGLVEPCVLEMVVISNALLPQRY